VNDLERFSGEASCSVDQQVLHRKLTEFAAKFFKKLPHIS
jgi:hypothetical protein